MSDFKIDMEIKQLVKMGVPDDMAFVIAHINNGKADEIQPMLEKYKQEQQMIKEELNKFVPFEQNLSLYSIDSNAEAKNSNI
jgi:hypothetical protein